MALLQITIIPIGTASPSVGNYVADIQRFLQKKNIEHVLNDMGTVLYGCPADLLTLAAEIHELPFQKGAQRVVTHIVLDDRRDIDRRIGEKRSAVLTRLEEEKHEE